MQDGHCMNAALYIMYDIVLANCKPSLILQDPLSNPVALKPNRLSFSNAPSQHKRLSGLLFLAASLSTLPGSVLYTAPSVESFHGGVAAKPPCKQ